MSCLASLYLHISCPLSRASSDSSWLFRCISDFLGWTYEHYDELSRRSAKTAGARKEWQLPRVGTSSHFDYSSVSDAKWRREREFSPRFRMVGDFASFSLYSRDSLRILLEPSCSFYKFLSLFLRLLSFNPSH